MSYIELLKTQGDIYEKQAIKLLDLEHTFPRYAEFWRKFVYNNRRESDASKLRTDYSRSLERIANTHYSILWNLLIAKKQEFAIERNKDFIDFSDPLAHLSSTIDLVRTIFTLQWLESENSNPADLEKYLRNNRKGKFENIVEVKQRKIFDKLSKEINDYRNILIHSIPPIMKRDASGALLVPKFDVIKVKKLQYWSSSEADSKDFVLAYRQINKYLQDFIVSINALWERLIPKMQTYVDNSDVRPNPKQTIQETNDDKIPYSGDSATIEEYDIPPSAFNNDHSSNPF